MKSIVLSALLVLAGCSGGADSLPSTATRDHEARATTPASVDGPDVRVPLLPSGGDSIHVASVGVLEVDGPCLYLRASDGTRTLPVFATAQTRWNRSTGALEVGNRSFRPGQTVTLSGHPSDALPSGVAWVQAPDTRCNARRVFMASTIDPGG